MRYTSLVTYLALSCDQLKIEPFLDVVSTSCHFWRLLLSPHVLFHILLPTFELVCSVLFFFTVKGLLNPKIEHQTYQNGTRFICEFTPVIQKRQMC